MLRAELARVWGITENLKEFAAANMEESAAAITTLTDDLGRAKNQIRLLKAQVSSLEKRLAIHESWNSRTSDNPEHYKALKNYREDARRYEAGPDAEPASDKPAAPASDKRPDNDKQKETRRQFQRRTAECENGTKPKRTGGQPNHIGCSRKDKPEGTVRLAAELCEACGTVPDVTAKIIKMRGYDADRRENRVVCTMYVALSKN